MVLTISTNTSAINVQRNLNKANEAQASSLAKLSSGSRVPTAKDDAASLAIGSRVEAEIAGLKQASTNASQATSLLQIADGAYSEINDILVRQSSLAIQSASGQLSDSERAIINSEFTNLTAEVDRIANDTEFNGNKLLAGGDTIVTTNETVNGGLANKGISVSYNSAVSDSGDGFSVEFDYDNTDPANPINTLKLTNTTTGEVIEKDINDELTAITGGDANNLAAGQTLDVNFEDAGITITLTDDFDRTADFGANTPIADAAGSLVLNSNAKVTLGEGDLSALTGSTDVDESGKLNIAFTAGGNIEGTDANLSYSIDGGATWAAGGSADLALTGAEDVLIAATADTTKVLATIELGGTTGFTDATDATDKLSIDLSATFTNTETTSTDSTFSFKIGTGTNTAEDDLSVTVNGATSNVLGTDGSTVDTQANANQAITDVKAAIDGLQNSRANVGASLSRLDFASSNLAVAIENQSAAKSGLLDVDVASETTEYAAQQVIVQAGVSLLAQANQQPSQLTQLIG